MLFSLYIVYVEKIADLNCIAEDWKCKYWDNVFDKHLK